MRDLQDGTGEKRRGKVEIVISEFLLELHRSLNLDGREEETPISGDFFLPGLCLLLLS